MTLLATFALFFEFVCRLKNISRLSPSPSWVIIETNSRKYYYHTPNKKNNQSNIT